MNKDQGSKECICRMCPTYFDCGEKLAFCLGEASAFWWSAAVSVRDARFRPKHSSSTFITAH